MFKIFSFAGLLFLNFAVAAQQSKGFEIIEKPNEKQVDILFNNKLLTSYCYYDSSRKPILFPINTVEGITVTRGYPIKYVAGERTDHPHQTGMWFNYESVNGFDFWNSSTAIPVEKRHLYGTIVHQKILGKETGDNSASLTIAATWIKPDKKVLLNEQTTFRFTVVGNDFNIERTTTLTATDTTILFKDVKDGLFGMRVARELEMPSKEVSKYVDVHGNITTLPPASSNEVTGMYYGSDGSTGDSVWGKKGPWVALSGKKDGHDITIMMFDHPANVGYPAYWFARGYGLFALNPLGRKIFSNGKEELNFSLKPGQSTTFRYKVIIRSGKALTMNQMNVLSERFAKSSSSSIKSGETLKDKMKPAVKNGGFKMEGFILWCPSVIKVGKTYHMFASRWPEQYGLGGWTKYSEIVRATSDNLYGPYTFQEVVIQKREGYWDNDRAHNPKIIKSGNTFVLYYISSANETGYAYSNSITGPWKRVDSLPMPFSNPAPLIRKDGSVYVFGRKAVNDIRIAQGYTAPAFNGKYTLLNEGKNLLPGNNQLEDPTIWWASGQYNVILSDLRGDATGVNKNGAQYYSSDGINYKLVSSDPIYTKTVNYDDGTSVTFRRRERPFVFVDESGKVTAFFTSCLTQNDKGEKSWIEVNPVDKYVPDKFDK